MLAAYLIGENKFSVREVPKPECPRDGLLIKVNACAICGTDLRIVEQSDERMRRWEKRYISLPRIIGHEFSGNVAEVGKNVKGFTIGENVVVAPTVPCMSCSMCAKGSFEMCENLYVVSYDCDGGFADYCVIGNKIINGQCVLQIGATQGLESFALAEPLSCGIHCFHLSPIKEGDTVVVLGSGPLGCFIIELAKIYGAEKTILTGHSQEKLQQAKICNPDVVINGSGNTLKQRVLEVTNGHGADLVITACSSPEAQRDALSIVAKQGTINFFSGLSRDNSVVSFDTNLIHYREITIKGSHGSKPEQVKEAIDLIKTQKIQMRKYISHRFHLKDIDKAFEQASGRNRLKILVKPHI
jgi:L-iditol 2-dehydrogenase